MNLTPQYIFYTYAKKYNLKKKKKKKKKKRDAMHILKYKNN